MLLCPWNFPGKNIGAGCHFLLWGIILIQGLNPHLFYLLHWKVIFFFFLPLSHLGSPCVLTHTQFSLVQSLSRVQLFATPWIAARQASLSITNSWSLLRLMSIKSVMPTSHLILCHPLLLLPPTPPGIRVFFNESTLPMRWPKYWSFSFSIIPSKEIPHIQIVIKKRLSFL